MQSYSRAEPTSPSVLTESQNLRQQGREAAAVRIKYEPEEQKELKLAHSGDWEEEEGGGVENASGCHGSNEGAITPEAASGQQIEPISDTSRLIFRVLTVTVLSTNKKRLELACPQSFPHTIFKLNLSGHIWGDTPVSTGNYIRVLAPFNANYEATVAGSPYDENFIIVEPLLLLPPTSIVKMVECARRPFLDKNFAENMDTTTASYLKGIVVHQLFQHMLHIKLNEKRTPRLDDYKACIDRLIAANRLKIASLLDLTEQDLREEAKQAVSEILRWLPTAIKKLEMTRVMAIEEDYSSERWGVRAKIDATIQINGRAVSALELKSGKYETHQYRGQVLFYALLIQEKYKEKASMLHWLVYILKSKSEDIKYDYIEVAALIKLRNKMASHQRRFEEKPSFANIPEATHDKRECKNCKVFTVCAQIHASLEENTDRRQPGFPDEYRHATQILTQKRKDYLAKWIRLIGAKQCQTTLPTLRYAASRYNYEWIHHQPFTQNSVLSPDSSSSVAKICYLLISFQKLAKGTPVLTPLHEEDEVTLTANSVPSVTLRGAILIEKRDGTQLLKIRVERDQVMRVKGSLSQGEGQQISDVCLESYQWSIQSKSGSQRGGFDAGSSNREFAVLRGNIMGLLMRPRDCAVATAIVEGEAPPLDGQWREELQNSLYLNFYQEYKECLSAAQKALVARIQEGQTITLLDCPVGCGKSVALAFLIKLIQSVGASVLLTGNSIVEIDHVLETLIENLQDSWVTPFVRIGSRKVMSRQLERYTLPEAFDSQTDLEAFLKNKRVFAANIRDCGHMVFEATQKRQFDLVIVLGAHTISEPKSLSAIARARRLILVGDSGVLPLKKKSPHFDSREYEQSLFQRLLESPHGRVLGHQLFSSFVLNEQILRFLNASFFQMKLYHKQIPREVAKAQFCPLPLHLDSDSGNSGSPRIQLTFAERLFAESAPSVCFVDIQRTQQQQAQAQLIREILLEIKRFDEVNLSGQVHVFTPVKSQVSVLRTWLKPDCAVSISHVDDYPLTRAKDCVILSAGLSSDKTPVHLPISTVSALMRGRMKVIIIGRRGALARGKGLAKMMAFFTERSGTHIFTY